MLNHQTLNIMKKILSSIAVAVLLAAGLVSCSKDTLPAGADTSTIRISVTPDPGVIPASGANFEAAVIVNLGNEIDVDWDVTVDFEPSWISVVKTEVSSEFAGTYAGDDKTVTLPGISAFVNPNDSGLKRKANLRFTTKDGSSVVYVITQSK